VAGEDVYQKRNAGTDFARSALVAGLLCKAKGCIVLTCRAPRGCRALSGIGVELPPTRWRQARWGV